MRLLTSIQNVLGQLSAAWQRFVEATHHYRVTIDIISMGANPGLCLGPPEIERLAEIRAGMDVQTTRTVTMPDHQRVMATSVSGDSGVKNYLCKTRRWVKP